MRSTYPVLDDTWAAVTTRRGGGETALGPRWASPALIQASSDESTRTRMKLPDRPVIWNTVPGKKNHLYVPAGVGRAMIARSVSGVAGRPIASYCPLSGNG